MFRVLFFWYTYIPSANAQSSYIILIITYIYMYVIINIIYTFMILNIKYIMLNILHTHTHIYIYIYIYRKFKHFDLISLFNDTLTFVGLLMPKLNLWLWNDGVHLFPESINPKVAVIIFTQPLRSGRI